MRLIASAKRTDDVALSADRWCAHWPYTYGRQAGIVFSLLRSGKLRCGECSAHPFSITPEVGAQRKKIAKAPLHLLVGLLFSALFFQNTLTFSERIPHVLGIWLLVHLLRTPAFLM